MGQSTIRARRVAPVIWVLALALAGCSSSAGGSGTGSASPGGVAASGTSPQAGNSAAAGDSASPSPGALPSIALSRVEDGAYPVTIDSALGSVTLDAAPQRPVTWGWTTQDSALALGVVPAAMPAYTYGGDGAGLLPWDAEALAALGAPTPTLLTSGDSGEVPLEQLAAAQPDVLLAPYSGLTQEEYATLSALTPVVAYPDQPWATSWQDNTEIVGQALGMPQRAKDLVTATQARIAQYAADNPVLAGKTFFYAAANQADLLNVYRDTDPRVQLVEDLGMTLAPSVTALDTDPSSGSFFYQTSYENLQSIDADVLVMYFGSQKDVDTFLADPRVAAMPQIIQGRFAPIVGESLVMATSAPSVLSIPWAMDRYVPILAGAAAKVS